MLRHVVLFTWKDEATEKQRAEVAPRLRLLPGLIPEIRAYHVGPDAGISPGTRDFAVVADFDSAADFAVYRDHPDHKAAIADVIAPIVADRAAIQYEI